MYCSVCGQQLSEDAQFCSRCGAATGVSRPQPPSAPPPSPPAPPSPPPKGNQNWKWAAIAAVVVVVIAVAVVVSLLLTRDDDDQVTQTTTGSTATSTPAATSSTKKVTTTSSSKQATSTSAAAAGLPGDSPGKWQEMGVSGIEGEPVAVALCDDSAVLQVQTESGPRLYAHVFASGSTFELPVTSSEVAGIDVDKNIAVWWEGQYNESTGEFVDQHVYCHPFPDGSKTEVTSSTGGIAYVGYPQIAGIWLTWVVGSPWDPAPDEYWHMPIYGSFVSLGEDSANEPQELVPSAVAQVIGDVPWVYSLGESYLAWEQAAAVGSLEVGTYVMNLLQPDADPLFLGPNTWRPSVSLNHVAYFDNGVKVVDLTSGANQDIDTQGDFATAAPSYVTYFRSVETEEGTSWDIVARGLTTGYEQVLAHQSDPPWLSPAIAASSQYIGFVVDGQLHLFRWKAGTR